MQVFEMQCLLSNRHLISHLLTNNGAHKEVKLQIYYVNTKFYHLKVLHCCTILCICKNVLMFNFLVFNSDMST